MHGSKLADISPMPSAHCEDCKNIQNNDKPFTSKATREKDLNSASLFPKNASHLVLKVNANTGGNKQDSFSPSIHLLQAGAEK